MLRGLFQLRCIGLSNHVAIFCNCPSLGQGNVAYKPVHKASVTKPKRYTHTKSLNTQEKEPQQNENLEDSELLVTGEPKYDALPATHTTVPATAAIAAVSTPAQTEQKAEGAETYARLGLQLTSQRKVVEAMQRQLGDVCTALTLLEGQVQAAFLHTEREKQGLQVAAESMAQQLIEARRHAEQVAQQYDQLEDRHRVRLNVGGLGFETTRRTLLGMRNTHSPFFTALLMHAQGKEGEEIFIDRDGTYFRLVLNHLRGQDVSQDLVELSAAGRETLRHDAVHYQIKTLLDML